MNTLTLLSDAKYFQEGNTRVAELKKMLDSKLDKERLEAMKRLIAMITVGRDASAFFPDVVKSIIVKNMEVKKLVYMFLIHYAEENQELALLSINSFQKDLASENANVRASAMKAMSDIRIPVVVPLVVLALKTAVKDRAPQVCKAAACAIVKVYRVDPDQKDTMVELIKELMASTHPGVLGTALYAYSAVCPENVEMLHPHFIKIYHLIADFEEWAQIVAIGILMRYGRTQFTCPFEEEGDEDPSKPKKAFYSEDESSDSDEERKREEEKKKRKKKNDEDKKAYPMAEHHRELLTHCGKLIFSPNAGVILAVATLFYYLAPQIELSKATRPLVRLLSTGRREVSYAILTNIATMAAQRPGAFRPHLQDFYVFASDPLYVRKLKLNIMTNTCSEASISQVLQEFTTYTKDPNKEFVAETVQAIGRVAQLIPAESERCLRFLMRLVQSPSDHVVAQAVVMIRQLLQSGDQAKQHVNVIKSLVKLLDTVKVPMARTALVWIVGEYRDLIPSRAPDTLRKLAASFKEESDEVKLQILNLAVKLFLSNPKQTSLLFKYVMDLCKYDLSYDLRDRARLLRSLFFKKKGDAGAAALGTEVKERLKDVLLANKPAPLTTLPFKARDRWVLGSLSHLLDRPIPGYEPLPDFALVPSDPSLRAPLTATADSGEFLGSGSESSSASGSDKSDSDSGSGSGSDSEDSDAPKAKRKQRKSVSDSDTGSGSNSEPESDKDSESAGSLSESGSDSSASDSDSDSEAEQKRSKRKKQSKAASKATAAAAATASQGKGGTVDLLDLSALKSSSSSASSTSPTSLNLNVIASSFGVASSSSSSSSASSSSSTAAAPKVSKTGAVSTPRRGLMGQLLNSIKGGGLQVNFAIDRKPSLFSAKMNPVSLTLLNKSSATLHKISVPEAENKKITMVPFEELATLSPGQTHSVTLHLDFQGKPSALKFKLAVGQDLYPVILIPGPGEVVRPSGKASDAASFNKLQAGLRGMNESTTTLSMSSLPSDPSEAGLLLAAKVVKRLNMQHLPAEPDSVGCQRFVGVMQDGTDCLLTLQINGGKVTIYVNCADFMFRPALLEAAKEALAA
eukprot:gb/GEZN01000815.1/.p1 GENE.gb/GEZN01000815.1/~~gb/GEZN01000815.1/.p1  ORF type:complete len:1083 (+),score=281.68 gb/GEZN01000815.1/:92-3340(+)